MFSPFLSKERITHERIFLREGTTIVKKTNFINFLLRSDKRLSLRPSTVPFLQTPCLVSANLINVFSYSLTRFISV